ncbi:uncharacterized protein A4U43_C07F12810 [Asparagus officinalis]|uniref:Uncharacterized protein n=1 Tax=Asparagus officinalis TaxID=4686 RepID=A0A5P1EBK1_ASPOF|nr:uncharacterized protein A4U43_C07F12810 [Asparagus officinalis]
MAPMERGKANGISAQEAYRILFRDRSTMMKPTMKIPLLGNCMVGESEKEKELMNGDQNGQMERVNMVEGFDEKAEILCRQYSSKGWKPSLVTIQEKNFEKKAV